MKVNREQLLSELSLVRPGLSSREIIQQSSCFVFDGREVLTFNDEIACRLELDQLEITGAVQAEALLAILDKLPDEELDVSENDAGELEFRGKGRRFGLTREQEIFLPIDRVETPSKWYKLPVGFGEAAGLVARCAGEDESQFAMTCAHLTPDFMESCDNQQALRHELDTGVDKPVLVRATSLKPVASLGMDAVAVTDAWLHLRNPAGLIYSCRLFHEDYPNLDKIISGRGHRIQLPKGLVETSDRAKIFAEDKAGTPKIMVKLKEGKMLLEGAGMSGWYREVREVAYDGPAIEFTIQPDLLKHLCEHHSEASVSADAIRVSGKAWNYVAALGRPL